MSTVYHGARLTGYATLGALAGGLGVRSAPMAGRARALRWLPWVMVLFFVGLALRWERHIPEALRLTRLTWKLQAALRGRSRVEAAAALMVWRRRCCPVVRSILSRVSRLLSGSALRGVEFMLAFGLGTVPLLWLAQSQFQWVRQKLSPLWLNRVRVSVALSARAGRRLAPTGHARFRRPRALVVHLFLI